jgi:acyl carrier protein
MAACRVVWGGVRVWCCNGVVIFTNCAPVAQLDQSVWLRTRRSGVRISPGALVISGKIGNVPSLSPFSDLSEQEIYRVSTASVAAWDSVVHVTLLATIAEAFGQSFELEDFEELVSYSLTMNRLENPSPDA